MYLTAEARKEADRQLALLEMFLIKKGLLQDYVTFAKDYKDYDIRQLDRELTKLLDHTSAGNTDNIGNIGNISNIGNMGNTENITNKNN